MKKHTTIHFVQYIITSVPFIWIGFVCAISFMEAWLKFTAPMVTLTTGLSIGKVVFTALNRVEWSFALTLMMCLLLTKAVLKREVYFLTALIILLLQSVWILPVLSEGADAYISGDTPPSSSVHAYFILLEAFKVIALLIYGYKQLTLWNQNQHSVT